MPAAFAAVLLDVFLTSCVIWALSFRGYVSGCFLTRSWFILLPESLSQEQSHILSLVYAHGEKL